MPVAIVIAGILISGAVIFKDQIQVKIGGEAKVAGLATQKPQNPPAGDNPETQNPPVPAPVARVELPLGESGFLGEASASVTVTEFTDFQCPACSAFFNNFFPQIKSELIDTGLVKYVTKHFPLTFHPNAAKAAEAAECAKDQKKFNGYHDLLFTKQNDWVNEADPTVKFIALAKTLGLDTVAFKTCLTSGENKAAVDADFELGRKVGVSGTPTVYVNGLLAGKPGYIPTFGDIKELVDRELQGR